MKIDIKGAQLSFILSIVLIGIGAFWYLGTLFDWKAEIKFIIAIILLIVNYFSTQEKDRVDILIKYKNVITVIAVVSLVCWILFSQFSLVQPTGAVISTWTGGDHPVLYPSYYGVYFVTQTIDFFGLHTIRNTAIFTEAPMASFQFSIAFLIEALINKNRKAAVLAILGIAIVSTFSTTGIMLLIAIIFYLVMTSKNSSYIIQAFRWLLFPMIFVGVAILIETLFSSRAATEGSGKIRIDDYVIGIKTWLERPLLGYGLGNMVPIQSKMGLWRVWNRGFSNSLTLILAQGGIVVFLVYLYPIIRGIRKAIHQKNINRIMFILLFVYIFTVTVVSYQYLPIIILLYIGDSISNHMPITYQKRNSSTVLS